MAFQPDTSQSDPILGPVSFGPSAVPSPALTMTVHPAGPKTIMAEFSDPVDDSALSPGSWVLTASSSPAHVPAVESVSFYDSDRKSVVLSLAAPMTYGAGYALSAAGVYSYYGGAVLSVQAFMASVPDPPRAVDAVLAGDGLIDVIFDRPVGPYTSGAAGTMASVTSPVHHPQSFVEQADLVMVPWAPPVPETNIRFGANTWPAVVGPLAVSFTGVKDVSMNAAGGTVALSLRPSYALPYAFTSALTAQVVDAFVDSVSDGPRGPGRALISVFFNRPMLASDVTDTSKWVLSQHGVHPVADTFNVVTLTPVDLLTLITFCISFKALFNSHLQDLLFHPGYVGVQDQAPVVALALDMRARYNAHVNSPAGIHFTPTVQSATGSVTMTALLGIVTCVFTGTSFTALSVGRVLTVSGAANPANNGTFPIVTFTSATSVKISNLFGVTETAVVSWSEVQSPSGTLPDTPIVSMDDAILVLNKLKLRFNAHRVQTGVHVLNDPDPVTLTDATDAITAAKLADELRSKILHHVLSSSYHMAADAANSPSAPYAVQEIIQIAYSTLADTIRFMEEAESKFRAHGLDSRLHLYSDTVNTNVVPVQPANLPSALTAALSLKALFNLHLPDKFPVTVTAVRDRASSAMSPPPLDDMTYFAQVEVPADSRVPTYEVQCTISSEDLSSITNPLTVTVARSGSSPVEQVAVQYPESAISARFDKSVELPDLTKTSVTDPDGLRSKVSSVRVRASLQSLFLLTTDLMEAYGYHNLLTYGAGHVTLDTINYFFPSEFPIPTVASVVTSLNRLKSVYSSHAGSLSFHYFAEPGPIRSPDATDFESAVRLASEIFDSFLKHNVDVGMHSEAGAEYASRRLFDSVDVSVDGFMDGGDYLLDADMVGVLTDAKADDSVTEAHLIVPFRAKDATPYLAAMVPESGLSYTSAGIRVMPDSLRSFFTRPMLKDYVPPSHFVVSPPVGGFDDSLWTQADSLATIISGMSAIPYQADVVGLQDVFGNGVGKFIPPAWVVPVIPGTSMTGVPVTSGTPSFTYGDGRAAAFFSLDVQEDHVVRLSVVGTVPLEAYLYDRDMVLVAFSGASLNPVVDVNLLRAPYMLEVTVNSPLDVDLADVTVINRFDTDVLLGTLYDGVLGTGDPSINLPGGYANYRTFVASAVTTYIHIQPGAQLTSVWVTDGVIGGSVLATGSGAVPFTVAVATVVLGTYVVEIVVPASGPDVYHVLVNNIP